jgi:hypothetical protein
MSKFLASIAALTLIGAATLPPANAAERHDGISKSQSTDLSAQRYWRGRHYGYRYGPRRYYGPRYGYYGSPYGYGYGYPYGGYYRPGIGIGVGPFGFRVF